MEWAYCLLVCQNFSGSERSLSYLRDTIVLVPDLRGSVLPITNDLEFHLSAAISILEGYHAFASYTSEAGFDGKVVAFCAFTNESLTQRYQLCVQGEYGFAIHIDKLFALTVRRYLPVTFTYRSASIGVDSEVIAGH